MSIDHTRIRACKNCVLVCEVITTASYITLASKLETGLSVTCMVSNRYIEKLLP